MGLNWTWVNNLPITQFYDIEIDYLNPARLIGGTQDNNTIRTSTGSVNGWDAILGGDGFYLLVDYTRSNVVYAEYQWGMLHKSINYGNSMSYIGGAWSNDRVNWSAPVVMHPQNPNILYFGTYRVWRTSNGGNYWSAVSQDLTRGDDGSTYHTITTLAVSGIDPDIVLAGTDDGKVHISVDGGALWTDISTGLPDRWITRVAADPFDVNTIYATCSGFRWDEPLAHVYRSTDLGNTWEPISNNLPELPVNAFAADPTRPGRYFVGTDAGVFMSKDYGQNWESMNQGLGNVPVTTMKIHDAEELLVIGTYGLSAYRLNLADLSVDVPQLPEPSPSLTLVNVYPQPYDTEQAGGCWAKISSYAGQKAVISLIDLKGRIITPVQDVFLSSGLNTVPMDILIRSKPAPGYYLLKVTSGETSVSKKIMIL